MFFNKKKTYFKKMLDGVQKMIWDHEFKRFKSLEIREGVRRDYDQARSRLEVLKTQIKHESEPGKLKEKNLDEFKRLEDQVVLLERDIERYKAQMDGITNDIQGSKPTAENPNGTQGINQILESLQELKVHVQEYLKDEC